MLRAATTVGPCLERTRMGIRKLSAVVFSLLVMNLAACGDDSKTTPSKGSKDSGTDNGGSGGKGDTGGKGGGGSGGKSAGGGGGKSAGGSGGNGSTSTFKPGQDGDDCKVVVKDADCDKSQRPFVFVHGTYGSGDNIANVAL